MNPEVAADMVTRANGIASGKVEVLSAGLARYDAWTRHPFSGARLPSGLRPHNLEEFEGGDIFLALWPQGLPHLPILAQGHQISGESHMVGAIVESIEACFRASERLSSLALADGMTMGLRSISILYALSLLGPTDLPQHTVRQIGRIIWTAGLLLERSTDRISFNHRILEAYALFCCGLALNATAIGKKWMEKGSGILNAETGRQFFADGVHAERSPGYMRFVMEIYLHYRALGAANGLKFSPEMDSRLSGACAALNRLADESAVLPNFGDDSGLSLFSGDGTAATALALGAVLFERPEFKRESMVFPSAAYWLLGDSGYRRYISLPAAGTSAGSASLAQSGFYMLRGETATCYLTAGTELTKRKGHSHADVMSCVLRVGTDYPIIDPGSFLYHPDGQWRAYFRSTAAHNTGCVDGHDQAVPFPDDNFGWRCFPKIQINEWRDVTDMAFWDCEHDGYTRLAQPVIHRRRVIYLKPDCWLVVDDFSGEGVHVCDVNFQFAPGLVEMTDGYTASAIRPWGRMNICQLNEECAADLVSGQENPPRGWVSFGYGHLEPAPSLRYRLRGELPLRFYTVLFSANGKTSPQFRRRRYAGEEIIEFENGGSLDSVHFVKDQSKGENIIVRRRTSEQTFYSPVGNDEVCTMESAAQ